MSNNRAYNKQEQEFIIQIKDFVMKNVSFKCIDKLSDFNDCRETGIKKDKRLKAIKDEETKYYEVTKGCYEEYKDYFGCVKGVVNEITQSKEISPYLMGKHRIFNKNEFSDILLKDYKLI